VAGGWRLAGGILTVDRYHGDGTDAVAGVHDLLIGNELFDRVVGTGML
jgi:hypothetical protein